MQDKLYQFQKEGRDFLIAAKTAILGFEPGLGKSITALAAIEAVPAIRHTIIFCPAILKEQWREEILKWLPDASVCVIGGTPRQRAEQWRRAASATYTIVNYELLLRDSVNFFEQPWDCIIADEATRVGNRRGKQAQMLYKIPAAYRFALTGTPITNSPTDIFGIFKFIAPGYLGNWTAFINRYAVLNQWFQPDYFMNLEELAERVRPYLMRRALSQVLPDMPAIIESDRVVEFSSAERQAYNKLRQELLRELVDDGTLAKIERPVTIQYALVKLMRLRQAADSFELLGKQTTSSKLESLRELLLELFGKQVIIFTEFASMARVIARETGAEAIEGATTDTERQEILKRFREGQISLLVMTKAGQFGLNLQAAEVIIHYDQCFSLAAMQQRVGRAQRIGQKKAVLVYHMLARQTVDYYLRRVLRGKQKMADVVLGSDVRAILEGV